MEFRTRVKEWGNSMGLVIPKEVAVKEKIKPNEEIIVDVKRKNVLREVFVTLKDWKIDPQKMKDELREEWQ